MKQQYLRWVIDNTKTVWWHDSAEPSEVERGIRRGAIGATTNPFLSHLALSKNKDAWANAAQGLHYLRGNTKNTCTVSQRRLEAVGEFPAR